MKPASLGLAVLLIFTAAGVAHAAAYGNTEECLAALGALDMNGDGYVDKTELADSVTIDAGVDRDGDGRISNDEQTVACRTGAVTASKAGERK